MGGAFGWISKSIIGAAIEVHRELGPGLFESVYEACLAYELEHNGFKVERQKTLPVSYKEIILEQGYRLDLVVQDEVVVELKSLERIQPVHESQLLTYLKLSRYRLGLLINFNVPVLRHGIRRLVNKLPETESSALSPSSAPSA
ncbi:MAG TPA: GxxExxY protein [Myxococcales bacterium]|nr:GxxExxY protein [Myxococcales bacterium]